MGLSAVQSKDTMSFDGFSLNLTFQLLHKFSWVYLKILSVFIYVDVHVRTESTGAMGLSTFNLLLNCYFSKYGPSPPHTDEHLFSL